MIFRKVRSIAKNIRFLTHVLFSPNAEWEFSHSRSAKYASAQDSRLSDWRGVGGDTNVNDVIKNSSASLRSRARQLVRDFPYFANALNRLVEYTVGEGLTFQSRIRKTDETLDKKLIQATEDAFKYWADEADITGKMHYYDLMGLAKRQDVESGEFVIIKTQSSDRSRYLPYALQIYEADHLTAQNAIPKNKHTEIDQGIEYDRRSGRVLAYHFVDPNSQYSMGTPIRITADQVIHGFKTLRPGQLRGVSPFATAILVANDLHDYMNAEIDAAKMAAKYLAFIKTLDPYGNQRGSHIIKENGKKLESMENAIIQYLGPNEEVTIASNPRPGTNFPPFVKLILTMIGISVGVPYELISGDYNGMNYNTTRVIRNDFSHRLRIPIQRHIRQFCQPTIRPFFESAVLNGKLPFRQFYQNPAPYMRCEWQAPGMDAIDPLRETKSQIDSVAALLKSPQEIARARGRDIEDVYKEIKAARDLAQEMGLNYDEIFSVGTGVANNPAAIDGNKKRMDADNLDFQEMMIDA